MAPCDLWSTDYFDRDSSPLCEARELELEPGLAALWRKTLEEGLLDDGHPTFTWFLLRCGEGAGIGIPRDPLSNPALAKLRGWRDAPGLIDALAQFHAARLEGDGAQELLALAAAATSVEDFRARLRQPAR